MRCRSPRPWFLCLLLSLAASSARADDGVYVPYDGVPLASPGAVVDLHGNAVLAANDLTVDVQTGAGGVPVGVSASFELRGALTAEVTATVGGAFHDVLATEVIPLAPIPIGAVTVLPHVYLEVDLAGTAEAGMRVAWVQRLAARASVDVGVGFQPQLDGMPELAHQSAVPDVTGVGNTSVTADVRAVLILLIAYQGVPLGGPTASLEFGTDLGVTPHADPWWDLDADLAVRVGVLAGESFADVGLWQTSVDVAGGEGTYVTPSPARWSHTYSIGTLSDELTAAAPIDGGVAVVGRLGLGAGWFARLDDSGMPSSESASTLTVNGVSRPDDLIVLPDGGWLVSSVGPPARLDRLDAQGMSSWTRMYEDGAGYPIAGRAICLRPDGGIVLAGAVTRLGVARPVVMLLDPAGQVDQAVELDLDAVSTWAGFHDVVPAANGGYVLVGWIDPSDGGALGGGAGLVARIDDDGALGFVRALGGGGHDELFAVTATDDGGAVAAGRLGVVSQPSSWLARLDATGGLVWSTSYAGDDPVSIDASVDVASIGDGGFVCTGTTRLGTARDATLFQVDGAGLPIWWKSLRGEHEDRPLSLRVLDDGVILCGATRSADDTLPIPKSELWAVRTAVDGMVRFGGAAPFEVKNDEVEWSTGSRFAGADIAATPLPLAVTGHRRGAGARADGRDGDVAGRLSSTRLRFRDRETVKPRRGGSFCDRLYSSACALPPARYGRHVIAPTGAPR